ncbi:hypothetical protein JL720_15787 [Aureococcus anophagefferens]|nr:hypothetical protein JL720_15787 [Aureococcus anophagefferens]
MSRASVVGACAAAAGGALAIGLLKRQFATATRKTAGEWLRDRVRVVPHSVLGTQLKTGGVKVVAPAEAREVIVDPAGLPYVSGQRPPAPRAPRRDAGAAVARLLPVSGGVFSGHWALDMHHLTFAALALAYDGLDAATRAKLDGVDVLMCIFVEAEHAQYSRALAWRAAA